MSFVEVEFAFFFPALLVLYWLVPRRAAVQNMLLLAASYLFYATWDWKLLSLLVAGTLIDYVVGRRLEAGSPGQRRTALAISLSFSLGALVFFKYEDFFAAQANALLQALGIGPAVPLLHLALPLGISFYTLQRVGYILDVYWQRQAASRSLLQFATFCAFFPQVTAGPISRARELLPQLEKARTMEARQWADGALAFLAGFALKAWAAANLGTIVDPVFAEPAKYTVSSHWAAVVGYALQVFSDFAGYSLMAIGVARLLGIELPVNFNAPFLSKSLPEFWRRWHISLNRWLFDYIFTPLTTSTGWFRGRYDLALLLTFAASGLWHGANWTFVAWGVCHGIGMVVHRNWDEYYKSLCRRDRSYVALRQGRVYGVASLLLTVGFFVVTLVPFRAADMTTAIAFAQGLFASAGTEHVRIGGSILLAVAFILGAHLVSLNPWSKLRDRFLALPSAVRGVAYGLAIAFLFVFTPIGSGTFIYQQF